jgi:CHAT domain-containing protein
VLDFHRTRFALVAARARAGATSANPAFADSKLADAKSADSKVEGAKPPDSALADSKFANPKYQVQTQVRTAPTPECPSDDDLRQLAAGLSPDDAAPALTRHAATCNHCGPLLRTYTEIFSDDFTPEEQAALANLKSSSAAWQKSTAREMLETARVSAASTASAAEVGSSGAAATAKPDEKSAGRPISTAPVRKLFFWKWALVPATAAVVAVSAFTIWYTQRDTPKNAESYLARAYTQKRAIEMRWPGAEWGPPQITLGPSESVFSKPGPLIDAEKMINDHRAAPSDDLRWLRARAQAEILEGHSQSAIELLNPALHTNPDSVPLMLDLALAYSEQFQRSRDPKDSLVTIDFLTRVLKKDPDNRTALFNLAIAYSDSEMWDQTVSAWESYLRIDSEGPWAREATQKLAVAKTKLKSGLQFGPAPSSDVGLFLSLPDNEVGFRSEQYQQIALQHWLADAVVNPESREYKALARLAKVSAAANSDVWWHDLLGSGSNLSRSGAEALAAASLANVRGYYAEASKQSFRAEKTFHRTKNLAGELRARYESVYAQRRLLQIKNCLARADPLQTQLAPTRYTWLQSQLAMERAVCLNLAGQLAESQAALSRSSQIAKTSNLSVSLLRSIGFAQGLDNRAHRFDDALRQGMDGLQIYWASPPSAERIYQLYAGFAVTAQDLHLPAEAESLMRHAIAILRTEPDRIQLGAALEELSKLLAAQQDYTGAEAAAEEANQLFESEKQEPTSRSYRLVARIGLADLQLRQGKPEQALATLEPAGSLLSETDGHFISLDFYRVSGNIDLALHHLDLASSAYQAAIVSVESALATLKTERERLEWLGAADDAYRGLVRVFLDMRRPGDAWKLWEWYISRSYSETLNATASSQRHRSTDWPELWSRIESISWPSNGPARLVYATFSDGVQIWTINNNELRSVWVSAKRENLEQLVRQFSDACADKNSPLLEVQRLGTDLYTLLLQPLDEIVSSSSLISIELDRSLSSLPFEALRSPNGWYLAEKCAVIHSPGVVFEKHLRPSTALPSYASFLLADAAGGAYLPGHDLELSTISRRFPNLTVVGSVAEPEKILSPLKQNTIFGFIGHAEPYETGAALRMNPHLLLTAQDFSPPQLRRVQLAVLAACSTGSTGSDGLLDTGSLIHAFLSGGVPNVVATRWNVDSEGTAILISDFYVHIAENGFPYKAIFVARNHLLKEHSHPYYWAGFTVTGKSF